MKISAHEESWKMNVLFLIIPKSTSLGPTNYSVPKACKPFFSVFIDQGVYQN